MNSKLIIPIITSSLILNGCNQASDASANKTNTSSTTQSVPTNTASTQQQSSKNSLKHITGQVSNGAPTKSARVAVYTFAGKLCGETTTDDQGLFDLSPSECDGPYIVASEQSQDYGKSLYSLITADQVKNEAQINLALTPLSTTVALLVIGDHPQAVIYGKGVSNAAKVTQANVDAAISKLNSIIKPLLAASGISSADLLHDKFTPGAGLDATLNMLDVQINVDPDIKDYSIAFWMPTLHRPLMLRNSYNASPDLAYIDPSNGLNPQDISTDFLRNAQTGFAEVTAFVNNLQANSKNANLAETIDTCFMEDGSSSGINASTIDSILNSRISNLRLLRYNIFTDFNDEDHEQTNTSSAGNLAQVSFDVTRNGVKERVSTWLIKGNYTNRNCTSTGDSWRFYGNQRLFPVKAVAYSLYRTEVSSGIASRKDTRNSGIEFQIGENASTPISHVQVTGPGLPSEGAILVKSNFGGFFTYPGTLVALRQMKDTSGLEDLLTKYAGVALTDLNILGAGTSLLGISDNLEDPRNTYRFRAYTSLKSLAPSIIYKTTLRKRPLLSTEMPITSFPIIGYDNEQLLQVLANAGSTKLEWNLPNDVWKQNMRAHRTWLSRFGEETDSVTKKVTKYKEFSAPGSFKLLDGSNAGNTLIGTTSPARGDVKEASLQFRALDSDSRQIIVEYTYNLTR